MTMRLQYTAPLLLACLLAIPTSAATRPYASSPFGPLLDNETSTTKGSSDRHSNNQVLILDNGYEALLLRIHLIRNASRSIEIQTFIWTNDECGRLLMYELIQAAKRGVNVRIIADHFVSDKDPKIAAFLATVCPNIQLKHYRPVADRLQPRRVQSILKTIFRFKELNQRMHNKVMIFDNAMAITGGRNIENTYYNFSMQMNFRDRDVLMLGPIVKDVTDSFENFWEYKHAIPSHKLTDVQALIAKGEAPTFEKKADFEFGNVFEKLEKAASDKPYITATFADKVLPAARVTFLSDKPGKNRSFGLRGQGRFTKQLGEIISKTEASLTIQSPYFVLTKEAIQLFRSLRSKSPAVQVRVSSNSFGSTDNIVAYSANYRQRSTTIEDLGLQVYEFNPHPGHLLSLFPQYPTLLRMAKAKVNRTAEDRLPFLCIHAKSFVQDHKTAYIGSYNLDPRSENLNTEVGLLIEDANIAKLLEASIERDCAAENSWVIAKRQMPLQLDKVNRLFQGLSGLSPIDVWPIRNTSSFALIPGHTPLAPSAPDFYKHYEDAGCFPGAPEWLSKKEISTRIYKAIGGLATPLL
jgi:putative cardiolipin synthase